MGMHMKTKVGPLPPRTQELVSECDNYIACLADQQEMELF